MTTNVVMNSRPTLPALMNLVTTLERNRGPIDAAGADRTESVAEKSVTDSASFASSSAQTQAGQPSVTAPFSVLIVDDDSSILTTIAEILTFEGYHVQTARNGVEGLAAIDTHPSALVLLDMRMPVLDGWGVARAVHERGYNTPIIVMTAAQDARRWAQEIGAAGVLSKPFEVDDLIALVERFTAGRD